VADPGFWRDLPERIFMAVSIWEIPFVVRVDEPKGRLE
jgi:hypothetical protein